MEWLPLINSLGWPAFLVFMVMWKGAPWLASRVDRALNRHIEFVDAVQKGVTDMTQRQAQLATAMTEGFSRLAASNVALTEAQTATSHEVSKRLANGGNGH